MVLRIAAVLVLLLTVTACNRAESEWERAKAANTVSAFESFLSAYPENRHTSEARRALEAAIIKAAYRYSSPYKGEAGAVGIAVESRPSGLNVYCGNVTIAVDRQTNGQSSIVVDPPQTQFTFALSKLEFDSQTGALVSDAALVVGKSLVPARFRKDVIGQESFTDLFPDAPKSSGVALRVNPAVGYTEFAGLKFTKPAVVGVRDDGIVEADAAGVRATDGRGRAWVSRPVHAGGKQSFVFAAKEQ